jgi:group I intron endonuclease
MESTSQFDFPGIYQITHLASGKRYVGQAQNISNRIREHRRKRNGLPKHNQYSLLYRAVRKYGWKAFVFSLLERVDDISLLDARESFWIKALDVCNREKGFNICSDPRTTRGWRHTEETKKKLRQAASKRVGDKNSFFGKRHTQKLKDSIGRINAMRLRSETEKANHRQAMLGNSFGKPSRSINQIDPNSGQIVKRWNSISEACRGAGANMGSIVGCCQGKRGRRTVKGFVWRYADA